MRPLVAVALVAIVATGLRLVRREPRKTALFEEVSRAAGLVNTHSTLEAHESLRPWRARLVTRSASAAVFDYDRDGWPDVYLTNAAVGSRNRLFRNKRDGTFEDVAEKAGLARLNEETGSFRPLFFDADGDGDADLLLLTYRGPRFFVNEGGRFRPKPAPFERRLAYGSNVLDADGDGRPDVVVAYYAEGVDYQEPSHHELMPSVHLFRKRPGLTALYRNAGGSFVKAGTWEGPGAAWAVGVYDFLGRGRSDVHVAVDFGPDQLLLADGGGGFARADERLRQTYSRNSMSSEVGELEDGPALLVTNIHAPGWRVTGNLLWRPREGRFGDEAKARGVRRCGWAWGAKFGDFDNDGHLDLYVANGNVSARAHSWWYRAGVGWQMTRERQLDIRQWPPLDDSSWSGYESDCLFRGGGGRFAEERVDERLDGRAVAVLDYLNDGRLSVLVANEGQPARLYRPRPSGAWIGFDVGQWGTKAAVELDDGRVLRAELRPANGFHAQSDGRLHFGLGRASVRRAVITRPGGKTVTLERPAPGRYHKT